MKTIIGIIMLLIVLLFAFTSEDDDWPEGGDV